MVPQCSKKITCFFLLFLTNYEYNRTLTFFGMFFQTFLFNFFVFTPIRVRSPLLTKSRLIFFP